ncbi:hypothetical protein Csa_022995 [Cucumis sativus]|uniref:Uncharacterized protein n=1 Tax=Cucumis sativus TaxID=3659 RepID=A0A0A0KC90_CUCSA|nr:hypothetical protein Csa_022995 [Cucumis sativus]
MARPSLAMAITELTHWSLSLRLVSVLLSPICFSFFLPSSFPIPIPLRFLLFLPLFRLFHSSSSSSSSSSSQSDVPSPSTSSSSSSSIPFGPALLLFNHTYI